MGVSIIIINYNTFNLTCKCIQSVIEKTHDIDYEIILVDNASTERDPEEFINIFPNLILLKSNENLGFAKGNNLGIKHAKGEYVLLLNSDTELINNAVKTCIDQLQTNKSIAVISSALYSYDNSIQKQCNYQESIWRTGLELLRLHKLLPSKYRGKILQGSYSDHLSLMFTDKVWGTFFLFSKQILGQFPESKLQDDYFMYGEDVQWCYFIRNVLKKKILYYPEAKIFHLGGGSFFPQDKLEIQLQNRYKTLLSYHSEFYLSLLGLMKWVNQVIEEKKNHEPNLISLLIRLIFIKKEIN
jgi:GT2 family glycosyltransferase